MTVAYAVLVFFNRHCLRRKYDLIKRYGDVSVSGGSWAVVTGASDGIGAEFCRQLAADGFNIALVSRTLSKLQDVEKECKKINPKISTRIVQADFAGNANVAFYEGIHKKLEDLDIAILINNAGVSYMGMISEVTED
jgi:short-subunit dehydrogenase